MRASPRRGIHPSIHARTLIFLGTGINHSTAVLQCNPAFPPTPRPHALLPDQSQGAGVRFVCPQLKPRACDA